MIILDASPLIHLTKIGKIGFLIELFDYIIISGAVYDEVIQNGLQMGYDDAKILMNYYKEEKIRIKSIVQEDSIISDYLHKGEYESIQLAEALHYILVIDEKKGRIIAEQKRIKFYTTAGILLLLLKEKVFNANLFELNLSKYASNAWLSTDIYQWYLREGENYG